MTLYHTLTWFASSIGITAFAISAVAQNPTRGVPKSGSEYIAKAKTAAPASIVNAATGFIYMMAGDTGTSNHDPHATDKSHWVQTGPHVMVVGAAAWEMAGIYPSTLDPDPSQAYVMFPGTQYEHLMLPVASK